MRNQQIWTLAPKLDSETTIQQWVFTANGCFGSGVAARLEWQLFSKAVARTSCLGKSKTSEIGQQQPFAGRQFATRVSFEDNFRQTSPARSAAAPGNSLRIPDLAHTMSPYTEDSTTTDRKYAKPPTIAAQRIAPLITRSQECVSAKSILHVSQW